MHRTLHTSVNFAVVFNGTASCKSVFVTRTGCHIAAIKRTAIFRYRVRGIVIVLKGNCSARRNCECSRRKRHTRHGYGIWASVATGIVIVIIAAVGAAATFATRRKYEETNQADE